MNFQPKKPLLTLSDFVTQLEAETSNFTFDDAIEIVEYNNFLKQQLTKEMFVGPEAIFFDCKKDYYQYFLKTIQDLAELSKKEGTFVTLHKKGNLRGCIGHMQARIPLYKAVVEMAVSAAFEDPRFMPVKNKKELEGLEIEISVLSPMERIYDHEKIRMGIDGVWIRKGIRSGVYLPQVATETGWSRTEFLESLCSGKAGLTKDAYKDPDTEIYIYQVEKFTEGELK